MSKIGIVTVLYNSESVLDEFFRTLDEQSFKDFTLYVIDNASSDRSLAEARRLAESVSFQCVFFAETQNWGVAKGNNIGIKAAMADGCEYVLLSNNDIVLRPDTIQRLFDSMAAMHADMAVPKIYYHDSGLIWCAGGKFTYFRGGTVHFGLMKRDDGRYDRCRYVEYAPTCFMLIKREVFEEVGLMDERYFVYYDDTDFVWRAVKQSSLKLAYIPSSTLRHKESACTGNVGSDFKVRYLGRNSRYFALKNYTGIRKALTILYSDLHTLLIKPFTHTHHQLKVHKEATTEGKRMIR